MPIKARRCFVAMSPSRWVARVFLTCDNMLAVEYRHGQKIRKVLPHGPGAYLGHGGVPHVCCLYPGTQGAWAETLYELAQAWSYGGEWVHHFLYRKFGYRLIVPPSQCGGCNTVCSLEINPARPGVGQVVTITCRITNTDGSPTKGEAPQGTVTFYVDGVDIGTVPLPEDKPDSKNWAECSMEWGASCQPNAIHTIQATYAPSEGDFAATSCQATVQVQGCDTVIVPCCPNVPLPKRLYVTLSNSAGCDCLLGTYPLDWVGGGQLADGGWASSVGAYCGSPATQIAVYCYAPYGFYLGFLQGGYLNPNSVSLLAQSCSPLLLTGQCFFNPWPCIGSIQATVTE